MNVQPNEPFADETPEIVEPSDSDEEEAASFLGLPMTLPKVEPEDDEEPSMPLEVTAPTPTNIIDLEPTTPFFTPRAGEAIRSKPLPELKIVEDDDEELEQDNLTLSDLRAFSFEQGYYSSDEEHLNNESKQPISRKSAAASTSQLSEEDEYDELVPIIRRKPTLAQLQLQPPLPRIKKIEQETLLFKFLQTVTNDEDIKKHLTKEYESSHWDGIRNKYTSHSSSRKGRWSEKEMDLISKYIRKIKKNKQAPPETAKIINVILLKHFIALIIGRSWKALENEWNRQQLQTQKIGDTFEESIATLRRMMDDPEQKAELGEETISAYNDLLETMREYTQAVQKGQANPNAYTSKFKELAERAKEIISSLTSAKDSANEKMHDCLWKATFEKYGRTGEAASSEVGENEKNASGSNSAMEVDSVQ